MTGHEWLTLIVIVVVVVVMVREILPPAAAVLGGSIVLLVTGVVEAEEAFSGFSNQAPLTIAALYVVAAAVTRTGLLRPLLTMGLQSANADRSVLARLLPGIAAGSSVFNNTPIVAMLVPELSNWAIRRGSSPSRFLMPLSFAAIAGGTVTLIGTSTNLVVSGLLANRTGEGFGFFTVTPVGIVIAVGIVAMLIMFSGRLLPDHRSPQEDLAQGFKEFTTEMVVTPGGPLDGATVEDGGLRHLASMFLVEVSRNEHLIAPVGPDLQLSGGDRLRFVGKAGEVVDLLDMPGLESAHADQLSGFDLVRSDFFEAVIGPSSPLVGKTLRETDFRRRYQAAVVAIHRGGARIDAKLGQVRLRTADTLVLLAASGFRSMQSDRGDFLLVAPIGAPTITDSRHRRTVLAVMVGLLVLAGSSLMPILNVSLLAGLVLVALGVLAPSQARDAIDLNVVLLVAASFGLAAAMETSGLAERMASGLVDVMEPFGVLGVLVGVVVATMFLTELVSNAAAAVVVFPIAFAAALDLGADPVGFAVAVAIAASAGFLTPIGYQTNMMVYGPGGYRFADYLRLGVPMSVFSLLATVTVVNAVWL